MNTKQKQSQSEKRATRFAELLPVYPDDEHTNVTTFLADAMHWCRQNQEDFHSQVLQASWYVFCELNEHKTPARNAHGEYDPSEDGLFLRGCFPGPFTYRRRSDGCDETWEIYSPVNVHLVSIPFWDDVAGTEGKAQLIVDCLNLGYMLVTGNPQTLHA